MAEKLLEGAEVVAPGQQVGREAVAQGVDAGSFGDLGLGEGGLESALEPPRVEMMAPEDSGPGVARDVGGWKDPEPGPRFAGAGILAG